MSPVVSIAVLSGLGVTVAYFICLFMFQCWKLRDFRGPFAIPLMGNCYNPEALSFLRILGKLRKSFGRLFTFFVFTKPYLVVCDPNVARRVLSDTKSFPKGSDYSSQFALVFGEGLVTSGNEKHKNDRAIFGKYFIRSSIATIMPMVNERAMEAFDTFFRDAMGKENSMAFNVERVFARLSLRIFMGFALHTDYRHDLERESYICRITSKASYDMGRIITLNIPSWDIFPMVRTVKEFRRELWRDMKVLVEKRRAQMERGEAEDIDDCLTAMIKNNMQEKEMIDHFATLVGAGHDTTAFFSSYICLLLAENPDCQQKLRDEIFTKLGDRTDISADDIAEMKYLHKVLQEVLRLFAVIPAMTRTAATTVTIKESDNVTIPEGTNVLIPVFLMNRDPEIWQHPSKFDPDRFDGKGDYTSAKMGFFPFGYGSRTCIGNTLAQLEASTFMCHLLRRYTIEKEPGFKVNINAGISLTTSNGIRVILKKL